MPNTLEIYTQQIGCIQPINLYDVSISTVLSSHLFFCFLSCKRLCDVVLFYFVKEVKDGSFCILHPLSP